MRRNLLIPFRYCVLPTDLPVNDRAALRRRCVTYHFVTVLPTYRPTFRWPCCLSRMRRNLPFRDRVLPLTTDPSVAIAVLPSSDAAEPTIC